PLPHALFVPSCRCRCPLFFFFNDTPTTALYPLSLHDALPICRAPGAAPRREGTRATRAEMATVRAARSRAPSAGRQGRARGGQRSEEHTSELQSLTNLVCRLLLEKKKQTNPLTNDVLPLSSHL